MELIIISGRSGSGKSVALRALEDVGYYCVDNIPLPLIPALVSHLSGTVQNVALSLDIRNYSGDGKEFEQILTDLPKNVSTKLIFLECESAILIRRYSDSRRLHPLSVQNLSLESAIEQESEQLESLVHQANHIIDTSHLSSHALAEKLRELLRGDSDKVLQIIVESFGFKYGIPTDADYVFDVRFLPNPHWDIELRPMTGLDQPVINFLERHTEVHNFVYQTCRYLEMWLPSLEKNNRSYLTIAVGCTGGKHRSVFVAEQLAKFFASRDKQVKVRHRSLEKYHKSS